MSSASMYVGARVLVVSPIEGGSLPVSRYAARALEEIGASVRHLDFSWLAAPSGFGKAARSPEALVHLVEYASRLIQSTAKQFRPDLCLVLAQAPVTENAVAELRALGITTAFWFVENYRVTDYWKRVASLYDWFFTLQRGAFHQKLAAVGAKNVAWLPLACDPSRHRPLRLNGSVRKRYGSRLSFAGYGYFNRRQLFRHLVDYNFKVWGPGWKDSRVAHLVQEKGRPFSEKEFVRIASAADINLNLHSATHISGVDPDGDYLNPRTFELAGCGAFQIMDWRRDLSEFFEPETQIPVFHDLAELRDKIDYYVNNHEQRSRIAKAARGRVLSQHTYRHRMETILRLVLDSRPDPTERISQQVAAVDPAVFPHISAVIKHARLTRPQELLQRLEIETSCSDEETLLRIADALCDRSED